jgi:hypothetical protein
MQITVTKPILLTVTLALGFLGLTLLEIQCWRSSHAIANLRADLAIKDDYVPVAEYNKLVKAERSLNTLSSNLEHMVRSHQFRLDEVEKLSVITNLYVKMAEFEQKLTETAESAQASRKEAELLLRIGGKLDALEKAFIKLSLAVQETQEKGALPSANAPPEADLPNP